MPAQVPSLFSAFEACRMVARLMAEGSAFVYSVIADPQGSGRAMIVIREQNGSFVGAM
jgi:hypothetical protein